MMTHPALMGVSIFSPIKCGRESPPQLPLEKYYSSKRLNFYWNGTEKCTFTCGILWGRAGRNIEVLDGNGKQGHKLTEA